MQIMWLFVSIKPSDEGFILKTTLRSKSLGLFVPLTLLKIYYLFLVYTRRDIDIL